VTFEGPGRGKFPELVTHHLLGHIDRHVGFAVVDGNGVADHHRQDGGGPRPGFDHRLLAGRIELFHLAEEAVGDEWSFFE
jgi:hypothetical protein